MARQQQMETNGNRNWKNCSTQVTPSSNRGRGKTHQIWRPQIPDPRTSYRNCSQATRPSTRPNFRRVSTRTFVICSNMSNVVCDHPDCSWMCTAFLILFCLCHVTVGPSKACKDDVSCGCCMCISDARPGSARVVLGTEVLALDWFVKAVSGPRRFGYLLRALSS